MPQHLGQAPIHYLDFAKSSDHYVVRLQVAVDDAPRMGVRHGLAHLFEDLQEAGLLAGRIPTLAQQLVERPAAHQPHREERVVAVLLDGIDGYDAGVLQLGSDLCLFQESPARFATVTVIVSQDFDGQLAAELGVAGQVNDAHAALS
jgi:hypothetical protein